MKVEFYDYNNLGMIIDPESDTKQRTVILVGKQIVKCNPRRAIICFSEKRIDEQSELLPSLEQYCAEKNVMLVCPKDDTIETLVATFRYLFKEYLSLNILRDELNIGIIHAEKLEIAKEFQEYLLDEYDVETGEIERIKVLEK